MNIAQIGIGALAGLVYGLIGYAKNKRQNTKTAFSTIATIKPIVICAVVGGVAGYMGLDVSNMGLLVTGTVGVTVTKVIDQIWGIVFKK